MGDRAKDLTLVMHIGLHKTGTTYMQNLFSAHRHDLLRAGLLYPSTGVASISSSATREGAQSGHGLLTRSSNGTKQLVAQLMDEIPRSATTVLLSSENFTLRDRPPEQHIQKFAAFGTIKVVLVLRRQDSWIESYYKQVIDGHRDFETRSFDAFLEQEGPLLLDFYSRFSPWRELVGPDNFHVLSYDDEPDATALCRKIVEIAGVSADVLGGAAPLALPSYHSVRAIDTLGLRILNAYRVPVRERRSELAKAIYDVAPEGDIELLTPEMQQAIESVYAPINERIEAEWFKTPVPGFRFGRPRRGNSLLAPSGPDVLRYLDQVLTLCETDFAHHKTEEATE